jgi:GntR family transcriptional regulator, transcriptional repressor for pyruvate dehydrogenase complex
MTEARDDGMGLRLRGSSLSDAVDSERPLRPTVSDYVTEQLLELIRVRELQEGSRLPSVMALARSLSVAGPTVRESLRRLEAIGVVEIRHGSGVYVRNPPSRVLLANPYPGPLEKRTILELLDARLVIEPTLARRTTVNATDDEVEELGRILEEAAPLLDGHDRQLHGVNMAFHRRVARLSGNPILAQAIDSIVDLYTTEQLLILRLFDDRRKDHDEHLAIFDAIGGRDADGAADLMRDHLEDVLGVLEERLGEAGAAHAALRLATRREGVEQSGRD